MKVPRSNFKLMRSNTQIVTSQLYFSLVEDDVRALKRGIASAIGCKSSFTIRDEKRKEKERIPKETSRVEPNYSV